MNAVTGEYYLELRQRLESAAHGKKRALIAEAAGRLQTSVQSVYRTLTAVGFESGRKPRADKGATCVDEGLARRAAGMVATARRANGKKTLPLTVARQILAANGEGAVDADTGEVFMPSAATLSRVMYRVGCHPEQVKKGSPAQEMRSLHPNHVWQIDASVCVVFYLPRGEVRVIDEAKVYKNKPANLEKVNRERVIRYVVTDHRSGCLFVRYRQGAEDSFGVIDVMIEVMCKREAEGDVLHGVPLILVSDKGSGLTSNLAKSLFTPLGITCIPHTKGNPRAKGQVEQAQNLVETQFEGRLRMYTIRSLAELNAAADAWRIAFNASAIHSRHGLTRNSMWLTITEDQLRIPASPEVLHSIVSTKPDEVKVPQNLLLRRSIKGFGTQDYDLRDIPGIIPRMRITIQINPYRAPAVNITIVAPDGTEGLYIIEPVARDRAGFRLDAAVFGAGFKALPDTPVDVAVKEIQKEAYAAATVQDAVKAREADKPAYADLDPMADVKAVRIPTYIPRRGRDLGLDAANHTLAPVSLVDAALRLRADVLRQGIEWTPECLAWLKAQYPDGVPAEAMETLAGELVAHFMRPAARTPLRLVSGGAA